jgi:hypothetical protein
LDSPRKLAQEEETGFRSHLVALADPCAMKHALGAWMIDLDKNLHRHLVLFDDRCLYPAGATA